MLGTFLLGACSFRPVPGATGDANVPPDAIDAGPDAASVSCTPQWIDGPTFSAPQIALATPAVEYDPFVSADELSLFYAAGGEIWESTRSSRSEPFGPPQRRMDLTSGAGESKLSMTADGMTAYFNSARGGTSDVWRATRSSPTGMFTEFDQMFLASVNNSADQWDPHISHDELRLYLAPDDSIDQVIVVARRSNANAAFATPAEVSELSSDAADNDPTLSADERVIVFNSNRVGAEWDLYYAVRDDRDAAFGTARPLAALNLGYEGSAHLSADGCRLYFMSNREGADNVWVTTVQ